MKFCQRELQHYILDIMDGKSINNNSHMRLLKLFGTNFKNVYLDMQQNHIAVWHDESHNNKYFNVHKPTKVLTPDYCFPEDATKPQLRSSYELILSLTPKLIALAR